jgi:hypothetical protein
MPTARANPERMRKVRRVSGMGVVTISGSMLGAGSGESEGVGLRAGEGVRLGMRYQGTRGGTEEVFVKEAYPYWGDGGAAPPSLTRSLRA